MDIECKLAFRAPNNDVDYDDESVDGDSIDD